MEPKEIVLFLEAGEPHAARLAVATHLAAELRAHLTGICACPEPSLDIAEGYAIGPAAVADVLAHRRAEIALGFAPVRAAFEMAVATAGVEGDWAHEEMVEDVDRFAERARLFDLSIARRPHPHDYAGRRLAEQLTIESGAPCLLVPEGYEGSPSFDRVVLGWNGSREARRAMGDSLPLLRRASAVQIVAVDDGPIALARASEARRWLGRHGVKSECEHAEHAPDDGRALLEACDRFEADLLVMGAYGRSPTRELILGGATRTVMSHAELPVFMAH